MKDPLYTKLWHDLLAVLPRNAYEWIEIILIATALTSILALLCVMLYSATLQ
jgi:hypothetical protein